MASIAMIAEIVVKKESYPKWLPPILKYILPTWSCLLRYKPVAVEIEYNESKLCIDILTISIAKGVYAGKGIRFGGAVTLSDGLFDITIFESRPFFTTLKGMGKLYQGNLQNVDGIRKVKSSKITIRSRSRLPVEFDGDAYGATDIEVSTIPKTLTVCVP
jgi:diacylglycerol kinase family enzyme